MDIKRSLIPASKHSLKAPYAMTATTITIHNTANYASAASEVSYMKNNSSVVGFHMAIDDKEAIQAIPFNRNAWHAGDGANGNGNRKSIGIEICYSKSGGTKFTKAQQNAAKVVAKMLKDRKWGVDKVKYHRQWSNTACPHRTNPTTFTNMVKKELDKLNKPAPKPTPKPKITYKKINPKTIELTKNANLWDFNFTDWNKAKAVKSYKKGDRIDVVAEATNALGAKYYMTAYSYNNGKIKANHGFNIKDTKTYTPPKPAPKPPVATPAPKPTPTPTPTPTPPTDYDKENNELLKHIKSVVDFIKELLQRVFK